jgi:hypothetical protein
MDFRLTESLMVAVISDFTELLDQRHHSESSDPMVSIMINRLVFGNLNYGFQGESLIDMNEPGRFRSLEVDGIGV